jgi:hypothetical protein
MVGGLVGAGFVYWLLWTSHGLRAVVWAIALVSAVCKTVLLVSSPRFSPQDEVGLVALHVGVIVFLLAIGWWGRTPEKSRLVYLVLLVPKIALLAVALGVVLLKGA